MVRLHAATGEAALAAAAIERRLQQTGHDTLLAAPLLAPLVDVRLTLGELTQAEAAAADLVAVAEHSGQRTLIAEAHFARGRAQAAAAGDGARELETALDLYSRLELPFEAARARLELARALSPSRAEVARGEARGGKPDKRRIRGRGGRSARSHARSAIRSRW